MERVLITGKNSYIGNEIDKYLKKDSDKFSVSIIDVKKHVICAKDLVGYDTVINVAGVAHIKETKQNQSLYFDVNKNLSINIATISKNAGVKQYILLSTMAVYGKIEGIIKKSTIENPKTAYACSKFEADEEIFKLADDSFKFACIRPPMVYGKNCKGNYQALRSFALKTPIFPNYCNERSMIFILNLCEFIKKVIIEKKHGLFLPQNKEYVCTTKLIERIARLNKKKVCLIKAFNPIIKVLPNMLLKKVFGNLVYDKIDIEDKYSFDESLELTEL